MNLSCLMSSYNVTKSFARRTGGAIVDPKRVDRALGYLMSPGRMEERIRLYGTTLSFCGCWDARYRRARCKHVIMLAIALDHDRLMEDFRRGEQ